MRYLLLFALIILGLASDASACRRCGLFGNRCRFVAHQKFVQPVVVAQQPQTVILQANYAAQPLGVLGATGYSYGQYPAIGAYAYMDRQLAINQLARLSENLVKAASDAVPQFTAAITASANADASVAAIVAKGAAATAALNAAGGQQQSKTREITIRIGPDGAQVVNSAPQQPGPPADDGHVIEPPASQTASGLDSCIQCHNESQARGGFRLDGTLEPNLILKAMKAIQTDQMPPKSSISDPTQRQQVQRSAIESLFSLVD